LHRFFPLLSLYPYHYISLFPLPLDQIAFNHALDAFITDKFTAFLTEANILRMQIQAVIAVRGITMPAEQAFYPFPLTAVTYRDFHAFPP